MDIVERMRLTSKFVEINTFAWFRHRCGQRCAITTTIHTFRIGTAPRSTTVRSVSFAVNIQVTIRVHNKDIYEAINVSVSNDDELQALRCHTLESCVGEIPLVLANLTRACNAANVKSHVVSNAWRHFFLRENVANGHPTARFQYPEDLVEDCRFLRLRYQVDHAVTDNAICQPIREGDVGDSRLHE